MNVAAPSFNQPSTTAVVTPGNGLRMICIVGFVVLVGGYALLQFVPGSINYLAIIPEKTIPFVWTLFTAGYIEQGLIGAICSSLVLFFFGMRLEPVWGHKELLKFIILVNFITSILAFVTAISLYYVTGKESFFTTPLSGFHGVFGGFLVAAKQSEPNQELPMCIFWKIKVKWIPVFLMVLLTVMAFIEVELINFLPTFFGGMYVGWIYLRYFRKDPTSETSWGDPSDDFSFPSFFPDFMRPAIEPLSCVFEKLCCTKSRAGHQLLPISDPSNSSRRSRERGDKAAEHKVAGKNAAATGGGVEVTSRAKSADIHV